MSAEHRKPMVAFLVVVVLAIVIVGSSMRAQAARVLIAAGAPSRVVEVLAPDFVLGDVLSGRPVPVSSGTKSAVVTGSSAFTGLSDAVDSASGPLRSVVAVHHRAGSPHATGARHHTHVQAAAAHAPTTTPVSTGSHAQPARVSVPTASHHVWQSGHAHRRHSGHGGVSTAARGSQPVRSSFGGSHHQHAGHGSPFGQRGGHLGGHSGGHSGGHGHHSGGHGHHH